MQRIMAVAGSGGRGIAARSAGRLSDSYKAKLRAKIRSNTVFTVPPGLNDNPDVQYAIKLLPDGTLRRPPEKLKSSGVSGFDQAVARAIAKSVPFPRDESGKVPPELTIYSPTKRLNGLTMPSFLRSLTAMVLFLASVILCAGMGATQH